MLLEDVSELQARIAESDLLVNAPVWAWMANPPQFLKSINLPETLLVADIIYQPFETPFLKWARSQGGNPAINGSECCFIKLQKLFNCGPGKGNADRRDLAVLNRKIPIKKRRLSYENQNRYSSSSL